MSWGQQWAPYVSVGQKLNQAVRRAAQVAKKEKREPQPVKIKGRAIAATFWGKAWCDNLTAYQDYSNRLPRGATYVRNGSVVDLIITPKKIQAIVAGSEPYTVKIDITAMDAKRWKAIRSACSESIDSLLDLLSGKLSDGVMKRLTDKKTGLFPSPKEIRMSCSCPDYSSCCKHLAAVMYGIGSRLDNQPELLFLLRGVDHQELVSQAIAAGNLDRELSGNQSGGLDSQDLGAIFGIELDSNSSTASKSAKPTKSKRGIKKKATESASTAAVVVDPPKLKKSRSKPTIAKAALKKAVAASKAKATKAKVTETKPRTKAASKTGRAQTSNAKATAKSAKRKPSTARKAAVKSAAKRS
jgi:uncharacterized Zn finger protein